MDYSKVAIVVSSCDFFEDCWAPFIHSLKKFWSDCEWQIYIISNNKEMDCPDGLHFIKVGEDKKFASNLKYALKQLDAEYIIYLQEDYFLNKKVDNEALQKHVKYCVDYGIDYMRLGFPFLTGKIIDDIYVENDMMDEYALCLQAAIWKKNMLETILIEGWSGWDFEYKIQQYAQNNGLKFKVLGIRKEYTTLGLNYVTGTAVRKGRWTRSGAKFLKEEGFSNLLSKRGIEGRVLYHFQEVHGIFRKPCLAVVKLMKIFQWNF